MEEHQMKLAVVVLAGTESHEGLGRIVNALEVAKEFRDAGDEVTLVFDGAGAQGLADISAPDHKAHGLYTALRENIQGACSYCAKAFGVRTRLQQAEVTLLSDYDDHPSLRSLVQQGYQLLTF
jgi:hypothetical protein